jgi:zinc/manganese transport system permease protein
MVYDVLVAPFADYAFMRRALVACLALALGCGPIGVLLVLRRMSLVGDAMAHAVLPGAAVGFLVSGLSIWAMGLGGLVAGLFVAILSGIVTRTTALREDAAFAAFYLIALALGVLIVSTRGSNVDLIHVLFGTILAIDDGGLLLVATVATLTLATLALFYRPLVVECFDPGYLRMVGGLGALVHFAFLMLLVLNLVGGFQAMGTLMVVGLMMLPAAAARFWVRPLWGLAALASGFAFLAGYIGLLVSFQWNVPSGPAIVLTAGVFYLVSIVIGPRDGIRARLVPAPHLAG